MDAVVRFHHGPFFKGLSSSVGFAIVLISALLLIFGVKDVSGVVVLTSLVAGAVGVELARGVRGVEIDLEKRTVLSYSQFFKHKYGQSKPLDEFDEIVLFRVRQKVGSSNFNARSGGMGGAMGTTYNVLYEVELRDHKRGISLFLKDFPEPTSAQALLHSLAEKLSLPATDLYQEQVDQLQERRSKVDPRSRRRRR